jgi:hypothetical protein
MLASHTAGKTFDNNVMFIGGLARCRKSPPAFWKVKAQAKAEMKKVRSSLNLDLDLSLVRSLRTIEVLGACPTLPS